MSAGSLSTSGNRLGKPLTGSDIRVKLSRMICHMGKGVGCVLAATTSSRSSVVAPYETPFSAPRRVRVSDAGEEDDEDMATKRRGSGSVVKSATTPLATRRVQRLAIF
jgi:hypothetical protein